MAYLSPFLYCTFIIAQSPLFVKQFFKIFLDWLSIFSSNQKALGSADYLISILLPFLYLVFIILQAFWFVKRFFKIFFFFFVSLFPYLVNILQQKFLKKSTDNFALISGYNFVQFFRRFRLTKYAEHGIMEFSRWPERQRAAQKKSRHFNWRL